MRYLELAMYEPDNEPRNSKLIGIDPIKITVYPHGNYRVLMTQDDARSNILNLPDFIGVCYPANKQNFFFDEYNNPISLAEAKKRLLATADKEIILKLSELIKLNPNENI